MGYHDRNTKPNLMLFVTAPMLNDVNSNNMINSVRAYMATNCTAAQLGATSVTNIMN